MNQDVGTPRRSIEELLAGLVVEPDPVYWAGYREGKVAALDAVGVAISDVRPVTISPARKNGSTRGATRRKAVFLDDVLRAIASLRDKETAK